MEEKQIDTRESSPKAPVDSAEEVSERMSEVELCGNISEYIGLTHANIRAVNSSQEEIDRLRTHLVIGGNGLEQVRSSARRLEQTDLARIRPGVDQLGGSFRSLSTAIQAEVAGVRGYLSKFNISGIDPALNTLHELASPDKLKQRIGEALQITDPKQRQVALERIKRSFLDIVTTVSKTAISGKDQAVGFRGSCGENSDNLAGCSLSANRVSGAIEGLQSGGKLLENQRGIVHSISDGYEPVRGHIRTFRANIDTPVGRVAFKLQSIDDDSAAIAKRVIAYFVDIQAGETVA